MKAKAVSERYFKFLVYIIVIVLINIAGITLKARFDLTRDSRYSLAEASHRVISTISEPLTIDIFFTKNLPAPHNGTERYLRDLLEEYSNQPNKYFKYHFYNVSAEEGNISEEAKDNQNLAKDYGIYPIQIQAIEKDEVKFLRAYMGLVIIHGDLIERIPTITSTDGLEYQITTAIQKLINKVSALRALNDKIKIILYFSSSFKDVAPFMRLDDLPELPDRIEEVVNKLNGKHYGKLEFERKDPTKDNTLKDLLEKHKIMILKWPAFEEGNLKAGEGAIGLVIEHGDRAETIRLINIIRIPLLGTRYEMIDPNELEDLISENIESLLEINADIGYLADHGTPFLYGSQLNMMNQSDPNSLKNFHDLVSKNYNFKQIQLKDNPIPDSFDCFIIPGPTKKFTDYELFEIDQYLMKGKTLAIFLDRFGAENPSVGGRRLPSNMPMISPMDTGLEKLLTHYGINIKQTYVMDENCIKQQLPDQFGGGVQTLYFAPIIKDKNINHDPDFMKGIKQLIMLKASPVEPDAKRIKEQGLKETMIFSSSQKSWEQSDILDLNPILIEPPESPDEFKSFPLAYLVEGKFESYFKGKPIPEIKSEEEEEKDKEDVKAEDIPDIDLSKITGERQVLTKGEPGKILVVGTSEILKDQLVDPDGNLPNTVFLLNAIDYLNNREDIAMMRNKEQELNPLADTGALTRTFIKTFNIVGLPIIVVLFGLFMLFRRHARKRQIRTMFQS